MSRGQFYFTRNQWESIRDCWEGKERWKSADPEKKNHVGSYECVDFYVYDKYVPQLKTTPVRGATINEIAFRHTKGTLNKNEGLYE